MALYGIQGIELWAFPALAVYLKPHFSFEERRI